MLEEPSAGLAPPRRRRRRRGASRGSTVLIADEQPRARARGARPDRARRGRRDRARRSRAPRRSRTSAWASATSRVRRRERERQRLAVAAGAQRVGGADVLLERDRHRVVGDRRGPRRSPSTSVDLASGDGSENVPLIRWPGSDDRSSAASPAVEITFGGRVRGVVLRHARRERAERAPARRASAPASPAPTPPGAAAVGGVGGQRQLPDAAPERRREQVLAVAGELDVEHRHLRAGRR